MSILLSRAKPHQCRWFVADEPALPARAGIVPDLFARQRVCGELASWPTSYCAAHRSLVYQPSPPQLRRLDEMRIIHATPDPDLQPELMEVFG